MDDVIGGLIGGVSANMYTRGMAEAAETEKKSRKNKDEGGVIAA
jgi:hypothetical protein